MSLGLVASGIFPLRSMALSHAVGSGSNPSRRRTHKIKTLSNIAISSLNRLHSSSCPRTRNPSSPLCLSAVGHIHDCARRFVSYLQIPCGDEGDDASMSRDTSDLATAYSSSTQALPLVADQVSLPSVPDKVPLSLLLPSEVASLLTPESLLLPPEDQATAPSLFLVRSHSEYVKLMRRMHSIDMVGFTLCPAIVNGLFCVAKPDGTLRLIIDARKLNAIMKAPPNLELPNPELIARLESDSRPVFSFKEDLENFYHRFLLPECLWPYLALPPVKASEVGLGDVYGNDTLVYPMCKTLAMGWSWAVFLAQTSHKHIVYTRSSLRESDSLSSKNDNRLDRPRHLIYIDDFWACFYDKELLAVIRADYLRVIFAAGHVNKPSKSVDITCEGLIVIGVLFHGRNHTVGFHPMKLQLLVERTRNLLASGECSGNDVERVLGVWTWAFLCRRPAFAIFSAVYRFVEVAGHLRFQVWPSMRTELEIAVGIAPLLFTDISSAWSSTVFCTDSSKSGYGVVSSSFPPAVVASMALIPPPLTDIDMANYRLPPPFLAADWTVRLAAPWRFPDHINVLEARALGAVPSFAVPGTRVLLWCDNTAVMHSTNKGRSSKFPLLRRLRAFSATVLATGLLPVVRYVPSTANPADAPSRIYASAGAKLFGKAYSSDNMGDGPDPNFLINASVGSATAVEYSKAVTGLLEWMALEGLRPRSLSSLDNAVAEYFLHLYFDGVEGSGRQLAANTVAGIHLRIPRARNRLHRTYLSLKGWKRLVPPVPAPPFTWDTALAVAASLQHQGLPEMASGLLLSFDAYLRVSELCNLRKADVADFNDPRIGRNTSMYLRLRDAKTGKNQWVSVKRVELVLLIRCLLKGKSAETRVFDFSPAAFRRRLRKTCCALGLPNYTPHSLRHGGATCDHLSGVTLEDIMLRGRWASSSSARRYIQAGRALLLSTQVPASVLALSRFAAANFRTVFSCAARDH